MEDKKNNLRVAVLGKFFFDYENERLEFYKNIIINNKSAWHILKSPLYFFIVNSIIISNKVVGTTSKKRQSSVVKLLKRITDFLRFVYQLLKISLLRSRSSRLVFFPFAIYKLSQNDAGKYHNFLMDGLVSATITNDYLYFETSNNGDFKLPAEIDRDLETDGLLFPLALLKFVLRKLKTYDKISRTFFQDINQFFVNRHYVAPINSPTVLEDIFLNFAAEYYIYKVVFKILKPKAIFFNDQVATGKMAAALESGIKITDLQHGLMDEFYPQYVYSSKLKSIKESLILPDFIGVFGQFHKDIISKTGFWDNNIVNLGNSRIEKLRDRLDLTEKRENGLKNPNEKIKILLPTQWHVFEETKVFLNELFVLDTHIHVLLKTHPNEPISHREYYTDLSNKFSQNLSVFNNETDIYNLFFSSDVVIGFDSTSMLEAIALGIPCITIASKDLPYGIHSFLNNFTLVDAIKVVNNAEEANSLFYDFRLKKNEQVKWFTAVDNASEYIYSKNYRSNCERLISKVISSKG